MKVNYWILLIIPCLLIPEKGFTREEKYKVSDIPAELLEGAKIVVRNYEMVFHLDSEKGAKAEITYAITILNENGEDHAIFTKWYNKSRKIHGISGKIYDKDGNVADRVKLDKVVDFSAIQGFSLFEDSRIKGYRPEYRVFPFTIEYSYTLDYNGILNCPSWSPYLDYNAGIEKSTFQIRFPVDNPLRYYEQNVPFNCTRMLDGNDSVLTWEAQNLPPIIKEPFSPNFSECTPTIHTAPTNFKYGGYEGNSETWDNFGAWIMELREGKSFLPDETKKEVRGLVDGITDEKEKIKVLYEHMQNKTRYANVAIGIGGYQPIEAETVDNLGYGDCKALSNYMAALLNEAGIHAEYTLVYAGSNAAPMIRSFPTNQFNHAMLCVPLSQDTIWLECTSQRLPTGFIGDFTDNRDVLVVTENGSRISRTQRYNENQNLESRKADVHLDGNGNGNVRLVFSYKGVNYGNMVPLFHEDRDDQKDYLIHELNIPSFALNSFSYEEVKYPDPKITGTVDLDIRNYTSSMGNRIILPANLLNDLKTMPKSLKERRTPIVFRRSETVSDSIVYHLPENCKIDNFSPPVTLESPFGVYRSEITLGEGEIVYTRILQVNEGIYPAEKYNELVDFYKSIRKADQAKVILLKETTP